ncbi:hypothetical protein QE152_g10000 [Popillia japonica]|uniref:Uncharacterized protein n=1 Tax=Popillia japonica TaxID=7064 RepID=A0AAW1LT46_POPJA
MEIIFGEDPYLLSSFQNISRYSNVVGLLVRLLAFDVGLGENNTFKFRSTRLLNLRSRRHSRIRFFDSTEEGQQ